MTASAKLTVLVLCGVAIAVGLSQWRQPVLPARVDTIVVQRSAKAETVAVSTLRVVRDTRTVLDSILLRDTLFHHDTVVRVVVESLLVACERCGRELASFRLFSDSVIKSRDKAIADLTNALRKERSRRPWWAGAGLLVGVGLAR